MSRIVSEINVHCSATRPDWMAQRTGRERVDEIRRWHVQQNGWAAIGYHWLVDRDGAIHPGRPESQAGAFEPRVNRTAIGICLIGGFGSSATDEFSTHYTQAQDESLRLLIADIQERHRGIRKITGHNDYSNKACPGFKVARWLDHKPSERTFVATGTAQGSAAALIGGGSLAAIEMLPVIDTLTTATAELQGAIAQTQTVEETHPLRWALIALILLGAGFALWRRWVDYRAGKK